jgi:hypothetical protein
MMEMVMIPMLLPMIILQKKVQELLRGVTVRQPSAITLRLGEITRRRLVLIQRR